MVVTNGTACLLAGCPKSGECVRHRKYLEAVAHGDKCINILNSTLLHPTDGGCTYGLKSVMQRVAYGFDRMYQTVPRNHSSYFHTKVPISSSSEYYRYKGGKKGMSPAMQELVLMAFEREGADVSVGFDHYRDELAEVPF